ncbi:MAG: hypothetical protein GXW99_06955 [Clostridiales bacterium]|nr:hypothetical protein [Clostridiales bacterium]
MNKSTKTQIKALAARYADCGIDEQTIVAMMNDNAPPELDDRARLIGVRMCLGKAFNKQEYFSVSDVCHVTGESEAEVLLRMKEAGVAPVTVSPAPWLTGGSQ